MTLHDFQRAQLVDFAVRESGPDGSLDQMKAIAYCIRNRVRQGWYEGSWLQVLEHAAETAGNPSGARTPLDIDNRSFQRMMSDVDEIYFSRRDYAREPTGARMPELEEAIGNAVYWAWVNRPFTPWFEERILRDPKNHPQHASMGVMFFFE